MIRRRQYFLWFHTQRTSFLWCLAMGWALLFGLILRIDAYNDDLGREADGDFGWSRVGRPFADWAYHFINNGAPITGIAPLGLILAIAILALAATLLASAFRCHRPLWVALASAGLFAQPYGLSNLSFQFDAPLMATAQLLAIAAACWGCHIAKPLHWKAILPQVGLLVLCLGFYQPAFGMYWVVILSNTALRRWIGDPALQLKRRLLALLACTSLALLTYLLTVLPLLRLSAYAGDHAGVARFQELPAALLANSSRALSTGWNDWHATSPGFWTAALLTLTLLLALEPMRRQGGRIRASQCALLLLLAWIFCLGPQLTLIRPVVDARTFLPFGAVIACAVLFCAEASTHLFTNRRQSLQAQRVLQVPLVALAWSLAITAYSYAHAYGQQRHLESLLLYQLGANLDRIPSAHWKQFSRIDFIGRLPQAPALSQAIRRFPGFDGMVSPMVGNGSFGPLQLRRATAIDLKYASSTPERTSLALAGRLPTLLETRRFHVMQDRETLVVVTR